MISINSVATASKGTALVARPEPPLWAALTILAATAAAAVGIAHVAPMLQDPSRPEAALPYTLAAIPFFFVLMAVEYAVIWVAEIGKHSPAAEYDFASSWSSITAGGLQQLFLKFVAAPAAAGGAYIKLYNETAVLGLPRFDSQSWLELLVLSIGVDFLYYWYHRCAHTNALLWLGHSVHHDAEHYNFSTALRQGMLQIATSWIFFLPLALFFEPRNFLMVSQLNALYQFWVHTCVIRRLGPVERVFMTPSHHRVHHDRRVHKNFGGVLIFWDKLFGSFLDEDAVFTGEEGVVAPPGFHSKAKSMGIPIEEHCIFGQRRAPSSWGFSVLQLDEPIALVRKVISKWQSHGLLAAAKASIIGPGYYTAGLRRRCALPAQSTVSRIRLISKPRVLDHISVWTGKRQSSLSIWYLYVHTVAVYAMVISIMFNSGISGNLAIMGLLIPAATFTSHGIMLDSGNKGVAIERIRCIATTVAALGICATSKHPASIFVESSPIQVRAVVSIINHSTQISAVSAMFWLHAVSAVLLQMWPERFERTAFHQ